MTTTTPYSTESPKSLGVSERCLLCERVALFLTEDPPNVADSAFKQQRLPAWQPILTAGTVLPTFFVIGVAFIPIGIGMLWFSDNVKELKVDYTDCKGLDGSTCADVVQDAEGGQTECFCNLEFDLEEDWEVIFMHLI